MNIRVNRNSLMGMLLTGDTAMLRLWFALWSIGWAILSAFDPNFISAHQFMGKIAPVPIIVVLCLVHATALMYGVITKRFNILLLFLEGVLGLFLWGGIGIAESVQYKTLSTSAMAGLTALFLLIRYPTHYVEPRGCKDV